MKIIHRVSLTSNDEIREKLRQCAIKVEPVLNDLITLEVDESSSSWPIVSQLIQTCNVLDVIRTEFSGTELHEARHLQLVPKWHHGYPQPENSHGFLSATYDLTNYCSTCGMGLRQKAPFRMKCEPKWGKRRILQLNWVFDEFFIQPAVWSDIFGPLGLACFPVLDNRTGHPLNTVVQLRVESEACSTIDFAEEPLSECCKSCGRKKYLPLNRGKFPPLCIPTETHMIKTQEYFGSGSSSWQAIIVSAEFFKTVRQTKLRGAAFKPLVVRQV
jgi:rRNA maturation protein Nop10